MLCIRHYCKLLAPSLALPPHGPTAFLENIPTSGDLESQSISQLYKEASQGHQVSTSQIQTSGPVPGPSAPTSLAQPLPHHPSEGSCLSGSALPFTKAPSLQLKQELMRESNGTAGRVGRACHLAQHHPGGPDRTQLRVPPPQRKADMDCLSYPSLGTLLAHLCHDSQEHCCFCL